MSGDVHQLPNAAQLTIWPEFHNGVSAGLRLLLGMGLQGTLGHMLKSDMYEFMQLAHDGVTIGMLLGLAASKAGTLDTGVSKTLRLHLPAVLPAWNLDNDIATIVQVRTQGSAG